MDFKGKAKGFVRSYAFLSQILPYRDIGWEKLSIFLIPKLPAPVEEDLSKGILEVIDMDSYRVEKRMVGKIILEDEDAEIDPAPASGGGYIPEPDMNPLSVILEEFNLLWGTEFSDADQVKDLIAKVPDRVREDDAYRNALLHLDEENARIEHDQALVEVLMSTIESTGELDNLFLENESFRRWLNNKKLSQNLKLIPSAIPYERTRQLQHRKVVLHSLLIPDQDSTTL